MGEKCVLYMQPYDNLPLLITATAPCCMSRRGLSGRSPRPFACCPPKLSGQDKICPRWSSGKRKIRTVWTVLSKRQMTNLYIYKNLKFPRKKFKLQNAVELETNTCTRNISKSYEADDNISNAFCRFSNNVKAIKLWEVQEFTKHKTLQQQLCFWILLEKVKTVRNRNSKLGEKSESGKKHGNLAAVGRQSVFTCKRRAFVNYQNVMLMLSACFVTSLYIKHRRIRLTV